MFKVSPCTDLWTNCLREKVNFMIFEMEFNSEIFITKGEYFKLFISEKKNQNSQPTDFFLHFMSRTAKSTCATDCTSRSWWTVTYRLNIDIIKNLLSYVHMCHHVKTSTKCSHFPLGSPFVHYLMRNFPPMHLIISTPILSCSFVQVPFNLDYNERFKGGRSSPTASNTSTIKVTLVYRIVT